MSRAPAECIDSPAALGASYATIGLPRGGRGVLATDGHQISVGSSASTFCLSYYYARFVPRHNAAVP